MLGLVADHAVDLGDVARPAAFVAPDVIDPLLGLPILDRDPAIIDNADSAARTEGRKVVETDQGVIDRDGLLLGYAGVYGSFLLHAKRAAERYGVDSKEILLELGRRKVVGGQEDMIIDVAVELQRQKSIPA